ncbi:MAG: YdeI/OmpD-associated family protein [Gemmatimonadota bacterium]|nr:YdeI/OmpD-associated family protein [Gemmatimonadota bacterium]
MPKTDPRVDAYIARSADFANPILARVREMVHEACPDVEETIKWGSPFFDYKGQMMCAIAAFKAHCALIFWKAPLIDGLPANGDKSRGSVGRITSLRELPTKKQFDGWIKAAMKLNDAGVTVKRSRAKKPEAKVPKELAAALAKNRKATAAFAKFTPGQRRECCDWISEAKREETRAKRVAQAIEWIAEGKTRNWKY